MYIYYQNVRVLRIILYLLHTSIVLLVYDVFILTETGLTQNSTNALMVSISITYLDVIEIQTPMIVDGKEWS